MAYILPKHLAKGDTIGIIAPSGVITNKDAIYRGAKYLETLGYNILFGKNLFKQDKYLAGTDVERLDDLHWAFENSEIDTIICARGGYGCLRLINDIDYQLIQNNPKNFCGYSDITVLSAMFLKRANLITYSSPMIKGDFGAKKIDEYTITSFLSVLEGQKQRLKAKKVNKYGTAVGISFGGNLASLVSLCGIDFIPDEDFIFFAEDLGEPLYKIDKMLTQLLNIPKFRENVKGFAMGEFLDIEYTKQLEQLFDDIGERYNIPVVSGLDISHNDKKATIAYGQIYKIDGEILENQ